MMAKASASTFKSRDDDDRVYVALELRKSLCKDLTSCSC
jgi:hypothetical protein